MYTSLIANTDLDAVNAHLTLPPGTTGLRANLYGAGHPGHKIKFFGAYMVLGDMGMGSPIRPSDITRTNMSLYKLNHSFPYNEWMHISQNGPLPIVIKSLPEGTVAHHGVPLMTIESTSAESFWLIPYLETAMKRIWWPISMATKAMNLRDGLKTYVDLTSDNTEEVLDNIAIDNGAHLAATTEMGRMGSLAFLTAFKQTSNAMVLWTPSYSYEGVQKHMHYTPQITSNAMLTWDKAHLPAIKRFLNSFPLPLKRVIVDCEAGLGIHALLNTFCEDIKEEIKKGELVDEAGNLVTNFTFSFPSTDPKFPLETILKYFRKHFGFTTNEKGYKIFKNVRIHWSDPLDMSYMQNALAYLHSKGYAADNISFGAGHYMYSNASADIMPMRYNINEALIDDKWRPIENTNKPGGNLTTVVKDDIVGRFEAVDKNSLLPYQEVEEALKPLYTHGDMYATSWDEVIANGNLKLNKKKEPSYF